MNIKKYLIVLPFLASCNGLRSVSNMNGNGEGQSIGCIGVDVVNRGVNVNEQDSKKEYKLHFEIRKNNPAGVKEALSELGTDVNRKCCNGNTPLGTAINVINSLKSLSDCDNILQIFQSLLNHRHIKINNPCDHSNGLRTPYVLVVQKWGSYYTDTSEKGLAIASVCEKIIELFLSNKDTHVSSITLGYLINNTGLVQVLVDREDAKEVLRKQVHHGNTMLHYAASYGNIEVVNMLISFDAELKGIKNSAGEIPLDVAYNRVKEKIKPCIDSEQENKWLEHVPEPYKNIILALGGSMEELAKRINPKCSVQACDRKKVAKSAFSNFFAKIWSIFH